MNGNGNGKRFELEAQAKVDPVVPRAEAPPPAPAGPPAVDLADFRDLIGDPADYFVHDEGPTPLVVRHADGVPAFAFVRDRLVPFDRFREGA